MANKEQTYTLKLDAEIGNLTASAEKVKKALSDIGALGKFPELDRGLEMVFKKLDKIKETAAAPVKGSTFTSLGKDAASVGVQLNKLFDTLTELARNTDGAALDILPPDMLQKLRDIDAAMTAYNVTIDNAAKKTKELVDAENALSAAEGRLEGWRNKLADATSARNSASDAVATTREELNAAQQRIEATKREVEERRKAIKELEELYEREGADKRKEIVDDKGNTRNLRKERNQLARLESNIPGQEEAIAGLEEQIAVGEKAVKSYNDRIAECNRQIGNWTAAVERNRKAVTNLNESFEEGKITAAKKAYADLRKEADRLGVDISDLPIEGTADDMEELESRVRSLGTEISNMASNSLNNAKQGFEGSDEAVEDFTNSVENAKNECDQFNEEQQKLNSIQNNIKQFIGWAGAAKVLSAALRNAFADIKELDKAMTEIAVVTDFEIGDMWAQLPEYTERANELGLSITSVYESSALFYQQGLDTNEMVALSNETLKMAKIAGLDAAEATDRMTAALRGFNMELDQASAQRVADVYSELAAITASDVDEISTAMTKTASIASSAGMEFETTAAFLSQIIETTRESAETAGTAMKTVIARFQELKKAPDEIGEIDGEIVDANQIEKALRSVGVSLRDAKGEFRELDEVFLELSSKWGDLDKNTQRYIATIAAGSRQQSRFIAMMQDYGRTQELVTAANNSAGASGRQYEKTLDSIETKLKQLDNAWTEFSTGLMNSDFIKSAVDLLTKLLNAINKVTKGFEGFTGSLSKIGTMVAIFQTAKVVLGKFWDNIVLEVVKSAKKAMDGLNTEVKEGVQRTQSDVQGITSNSGTQGGAGGAGGAASMAIMSTLGISQMAEGRQNMKLAGSQLATARSNLAGAKSTEDYKNKISPLEKEQIKIKKEKRAIQKSLKGEKDTYKQAEAQKALNNLEQQENAILQKKKKINDEYAGKVINSKMSVVDAEKQVQAAQQQSVVASKEALNTMAAGAQKAGQAIAMVGVGLGMVGQLFAEAGNEEAAEFFQGIGNVFTLLGSAIMGVAALIPAFTTIFGGLVAKMVAGGISVQMAWWWVVLIVAVVVLLIGLIVALVKAAKENSPEARLERAKEAADNAAEAADRATKAYEELKEAFEGLENGYEALDDLTKGTEEWNNAVQQLNQSVLDLIQQYPELAKLVDNEGGVLTLDMDSEAVQQILKDAEKSAIVAQNSVTMANLNVARAEDKVEQSNLDQNSKLGHYETYGDSTVWVEEKENTQTLAKALASGAVVNTGNAYEIKDEEAAKRLGIDSTKLSSWYTQTGEASDALREFGESLLETQAQEEAAFSAIAASAMQLANTLTMTDEELNQAGSVVDDATSKAYYDEKMKELDGIDFTTDEGSDSISDEQKKMRDEAIKAQYGDAARIEGNKVTFRDAEGKQQTEELTNDEIKAIIANNYATTQTASAIEIAPAVVDKVISNLGYDADSVGAQAIESVTQDQEGGNLTKLQMDELLGMDTEKLKTAYQALSEDQKKVFGSEQDYLDKIQGAAKIAKNAFEDAEVSAAKMNFELKSWMTSDMATGFTTKLEQVLLTTGEAGVQQVLTAYDKLLEGKDEATAAEITALMNGIDWTNQEALLGLQLELENQYGYTRKEAIELTRAMGQASNATSSLAHAVKVFGDLYHATQRLNSALEKTEKLQWDYERALKNGSDATELGISLSEQRVSLEHEILSAMETYELAEKARIDAEMRGFNITSASGKSVADLINYDKDTGTYNLKELQTYLDAGEFGGENSDQYKAVTDYIDELEQTNKTSKEHLKTAKASYEKLEQLNEAFDEAYATLYSQVGEALSSIMEQELEVQKEILEAEQTANDKLIGAIQEDINDRRAERDKEKTEQALTDLSARLAYLRADSSGSNALEIAELEKQLIDEQQAYQDSLIDDSLSELEDANNKAAEQRERQIALAEKQLEIYKKSDEFQDSIQSKLDEYLSSYNNHVKAVRRYELQQETYDSWEKANTEQRDQITDAYNAAISGNWSSYIEKYGETTDEEKASLVAIGTTMNGIENKEAYAQQWAELTEAEREQAEEAYNAVITGKWDGYIQKYGETSEAEMVQYASIAASALTISEDPGGWNAADTPLGEILETAGVTTGMDRLEKEQFWKDLGDNTSKAANSSYATSSNTAPSENLTMAQLLTSINNGITGGAVDDYQHNAMFQKELEERNEHGINYTAPAEFTTNADGTKVSNLEQVRKMNDTAAAYVAGDAGGDSGQLSWLNAYGSKHGVSLMTKEQYYAQNADAIASGTHKETYQQYVASQYTLGRQNADKEMEKYKNTGAIGATTSGFNNKANKWFDLTLWGADDKKTDTKVETGSLENSERSGALNALWEATATDPMRKSGYRVVLTNFESGGELFISPNGSHWYEVLDQGADENSNWENRPAGLINYAKTFRQNNWRKYKTGGLADFTGPAWLDGTKSRPEYVLNADQTERFFQLIDVLDRQGVDAAGEKSSGDNYFDIDINVESLGSDYDVEQIAAKIRAIIVEDASYRNVNNISLTH